MAAKFLLPGFGGAYTSEQFTNNATNGVDTLDCSRCAQFAIQIKKISGTPAGTIQLQQSFGAGNANLGAAINVAVDGQTVTIPVTSGPFGLLSIVNNVSSGTITVTIVGQPDQASY
jgi:hypothetical protein